MAYSIRKVGVQRGSRGQWRERRRGSRFYEEKFPRDQSGRWDRQRSHRPRM